MNRPVAASSNAVDNHRSAVVQKSAVAYIRASTTDQKITLDTQRSAIAAWAHANDVNVTSWHTDSGISGSTDVASRPGLTEALRVLRALRGGLIIAAKADRIARDVFVAASFERSVKAAKGTLIFADNCGNGSDPTDALMRQVVSAMSEFELALIRSRTKQALRSKKERGERTGGIPYGKELGDDGRQLRTNAGEQAVIALVRQLTASGLSSRKVATELTARGFKTRTGGVFLKTQVLHMLASGG